MDVKKLYQLIKEDRNHILFNRLFFIDENNQVNPRPNVTLKFLNGIPF